MPSRFDSSGRRRPIEKGYKELIKTISLSLLIAGSITAGFNSVNIAKEEPIKIYSEKNNKEVKYFKKNFKDIEAMYDFYLESGKALGTSTALLNYVWFKQFKLSFGYSFSTIHTTGYSLIAVQEMNLAYHYPTIYWNCACLSVDSSAVNAQDFYNLIEEDIVSIDEVEGKKTQNKMDYAKLASALDKFKNVCRIDTPDINESRLGFTPDVKNNTILYGLKGITRVTEPVINEIMMNRPCIEMR